MMTALWGGLGLTSLMAGVLWAGFGRVALLPAAVFGLLATAIQVVSAALVARVVRGEFKVLIRRWAMGMTLRLLGIVVFGVASWTSPDRFPPLPTAFAYLGVVVPLLFLETRFLR